MPDDKKTRKINRAIIHCSASSFGTAEMIDRWHKARPGWKGIGYHYVVTNGVANKGQVYNPEFDGLVEAGRPVEQTGAHCKGHNADSIGICLIGTNFFTGKQLYKALPSLLVELMQEHSILPENIYCHRDFSNHKTCPNIETSLIRDMAKKAAFLAL